MLMHKGLFQVSPKEFSNQGGGRVGGGGVGGGGGRGGGGCTT